MKNVTNIFLFCISGIFLSPLFLIFTDRVDFSGNNLRVKKFSEINSDKTTNTQSNNVKTNKTNTVKQKENTSSTRGKQTLNEESKIKSNDKELDYPTTTIKSNVPFTPQAPQADWSDIRQQNGCEEASLLMAIRWAQGKNISSMQKSEQEIIDMTKFAETNYGEHRDLSASTSYRLAKEYFDFNKMKLDYDISNDDIIKKLQQDKIVVVPVDGTVLSNLYYNPPGPKEHMIVIHGYDPDKQDFITHDPGTSRGENFRYNSSTIEEALRDYKTGYHEPISEKRTAMISINK